MTDVILLIVVGIFCFVWGYSVSHRAHHDDMLSDEWTDAFWREHDDHKSKD